MGREDHEMPLSEVALEEFSLDLFVFLGVLFLERGEYDFPNLESRRLVLQFLHLC